MHKPTIFYSLDGVKLLKKSTNRTSGGYSYQAANILLPVDAESVGYVDEQGEFMWHKHALISLSESREDWDKKQETYESFWKPKVEALLKTIGRN